MYFLQNTMCSQPLASSTRRWANEYAACLRRGCESIGHPRDFWRLSRQHACLGSIHAILCNHAVARVYCHCTFVDNCVVVRALTLTNPWSPVPAYMPTMLKYAVLALGLISLQATLAQPGSPSPTPPATVRFQCWTLRSCTSKAS
jgi:hypothetical protein